MIREEFTWQSTGMYTNGGGTFCGNEKCRKDLSVEVGGSVLEKEVLFFNVDDKRPKIQEPSVHRCSMYSVLTNPLC